MKLRIEGIMKFIKSLFFNGYLEKINLSTFLYCHSDGAVFKKRKSWNSLVKFASL